MPKLDSYVWRARVVPAVVAAAPLLLFVAFVVESPIVGVVTPAIGVFAAFLVAAEIARTLGVKTESRLLMAWNGFPTTAALRASEHARDALDKRRAAVERLSRRALPSAEAQINDPLASDTEIGEAVALALAKIRVGCVDSSLLASENAGYGFRRNSRGLKPIALIALAIALAATIAYGLAKSEWAVPAAVAALDVLLAGYWLAIVRDSWVSEQAEKFSRQFFIVAELAAQDADDRKPPNVDR